jgi:septal ring factor EnvC (AmiA/AmiB activator)
LHHKLEATCLNQEQSINELKKQLDLSKGKCSKLEAGLKLLEDNKQSLTTDSQHQLRILQQVIALLLLCIMCMDNISLSVISSGYT